MKSREPVIYVWDLTVEGTHAFGFGDIVRGMITTYLACNKLNREMKVYIKNHPISKLLLNHQQPYTENHPPVQFIFPHTSGYIGTPAVEEYISTHPEPVFIMTNDFYQGWNNPNYGLPNDVIQYIRNIFELEQNCIDNIKHVISDLSLIHISEPTRRS